jgi:predicted amidohydrolase YtcJ
MKSAFAYFYKNKSMHYLKQSFNPLFLISSLFFLTAVSSCKFRQKVSLIIHHANIYTVDKNFSVQQAMAVNDGKIIAVGSNDDILKAYESDEINDLQGQAVYPGFIDAHCHFTGYATDLWKCELTGTSSFEEIIEKLKTYAATSKTKWIYGRGWDQNDWTVKEFPGKQKLDELFPDRPVFLKRVDGHAALVNQKALDIAGINETTKIDGGSIELKDGKPTGILVDNAMDIAENKVPQISDSLARAYFMQAQQECFSYGLTGVHDCGISEHTIDLVDAEQKAGRLKMKIFALLTDSAQYYERWIKKGIYKTDRLHVGGFKVYADGALGSRGACLLEPYSDKPGWSGFLLNTTAHFKKIANDLIDTKFQMCTHAIGDSGNRIILNIYASVLKGKNDKRWRVEHAQVVDQNDFSTFGNNNIIPSVQPTHATSDMYWAATRLGAVRVKTAYAYKQLMNENGWLPLGTDFPVEYIDPFKTFYAAVARMDSKNFPPGGFQLENALTRKEALMGMTIWAAKAAFEENEKGSLEPGKAADFIILDNDLIKCPVNNILKTKVTATFINGEKVFTK